MAKYRITAPDGAVYEINAPDDAAEDQVLAYMQANSGKPRKKVQDAPKPEYDPTEGMTGPQLFAAGVGKSIYDTGRGIKQLVGGVSRAEVDEQRKLDAPLMRRGAGMAGNITGTVGQIVVPGMGASRLASGAGKVGTVAGMAPRVAAPAGRLASLALPQTVAGSAAQGGILGLIQPVGEDDSRLKNTGVGFLAGGIGATIPRVAGATLRTARATAAPFTREGQEAIVGRVLRTTAMQPDRIMSPRASQIPGVQRTLAEATGDPGLAQLQRQFPVQLAERAAQNNAARAQAVRGAFHGADDAAIAGIEQQRDEAARVALSGLGGVVNQAPAPNPFSGLGVQGAPQAQAISLDPVNSAIGRMIEGQQGRPAVQSALQYVRNLTSQPIRDAEHAYNIRKTISDLMDGKLGGDQAAATTARRELVQVRDLLDQQMSAAYPEWGQYLANYRAASTRADQARVGKEILDNSRRVADFNTGERTMSANDIAGSVNDPDALVRSATGFRQATAANTLTPDQMQLLDALRADAAAMNVPAAAGRAVGSDTVQNMATNNILSQIAPSNSLLNMLVSTQPVQRLTTPLEKVFGAFGVPDRLQGVLVEALQDPSMAARIMQRLPAADRQLIEPILFRLGATGGASALPALAQ